MVDAAPTFRALVAADLPGGTGDVTDVGDCTGGACFTGTSGNTMTFKGATSGTIALKPAAVAGTTTITLPDKTGTVVVSQSSPSTAQTGEVNVATLKVGTNLDASAASSVSFGNDAISDAMVKGMWLDRINVDAGTLTIEGSVLARGFNDAATANAFVANLKNNKVFMDDFASLELKNVAPKEKRGNTDISGFIVTGKLK